MFSATALAAAAVFWLSPNAKAESAVVVPAPVTDASTAAGTETAVLAGGCFWGVQGVFQHVQGVSSAVSGYSRLAHAGNTPCTPQKQPPASTAVSVPVAVLASVTGAGTTTADSALAFGENQNTAAAASAVAESIASRRGCLDARDEEVDVFCMMNFIPWR